MTDEIVPPSTEIHTTKMRESTSQRKIEANRKNALKATGPRTRRGKATAARNAVKHGILAREVIDSDPDDKRSFEELLEQLIEEYQPAGLTEKLLVERIASCWWRLKRVTRAENGEIQKRLVAVDQQELARSDTYSHDFARWIAMRADRQLGKVDPDVPMREKIAADEEVIRNLRRTDTGILAICEVIRDIKEEVVKEVTFSEERVQFLLECLGIEWLNRVPINGEWETPEQCESFLQNLDSELAELQRKARTLCLMQASQAKAAVLSASVPLEQAGNSLLRYETHIDRQLYRAIDQLERTQRLRKGDKVPPPLKLNVEHTQS